MAKLKPSATYRRGASVDEGGAEHPRVMLRADPMLVGNYEGDERSIRRARKYILDKAAEDRARNGR